VKVLPAGDHNAWRITGGPAADPRRNEELAS